MVVWQEFDNAGHLYRVQHPDHSGISERQEDFCWGLPTPIARPKKPDSLYTHPNQPDTSGPLYRAGMSM
jgi:hypothetical protein